MKTFEFTIVASGLDPQADDFEDRFFEAGCDDATIAFVKGLIVLEFARKATTFTGALMSAIENVTRAGATVEHVEPDYLVSLSDIAERCNLSRAALSLFAAGKRGQGFPAPVARVTTSTPLWDWAEVAQWMYRNAKGISRSEVVYARVVRDTNRTLFKSLERFEQTRISKTVRHALDAAA